MKINTAETVTVSKFNIEDAASDKPVSLRIEAAHAGIVNGNYIFYTPKALREGSISLKKFFKPLQKKHFDKTLGYIYDAVFEDKSESKYRDAIENAATSEELGRAVKAYYRSPEYSENKEGFGVLVSKARLYDDDKIQKLSHNDRGYVSIAGDSASAVCSICYQSAVECEHDLGARYGNEVCFAIADSLDLDHISFEDIPANWKTNTLIITDSQVLGKVELIEEGQVMKLTLEAFKEWLASAENTLTAINLADKLEAYTKDIEEAKGGDFLFPKEKLLPLNTKLGLVVAKKALESLEDGEDKETIKTLVEKEYVKLLGEKTLEEAEQELTEVVEEDKVQPQVEDEPEPTDSNTPTDPEPTPEEGLKITDADQMILQIVDSLTNLVDTKLVAFQSSISSLLIQDQAQHQNQIYMDRIEALEQDLVLAGATEAQLNKELKDSLISQIVLMKQVDTESDYFQKLEQRSVKELQLTLEDHLALQSGEGSVTFAKPTEGVVESQPTDTLVVTDSQKPTATDGEQADVTKAIDSMSDIEPEEKTLQITDADTIVTNLVTGLGDRVLDRAEYARLYKDTASEHGISTAKKLHAVLKQQFKI